jgi:hypothetical protein
VANLVFNRAKGRITEWAERVNANDPTNAIFILAAFNSTATDATITDLDSIAAIESDVNTAEATNSGYARKTFDQAASLTVTYDDTNDRTALDVPDQTWTAVATSPGAWTDLCFGYDSDSTAGTDSAILPATWHDFAVTPDGSDITATIADFYRAS